ncbi:MAG: type II toxin-antitoxin system HicB family antitoxin [Armatimonadetes bacterium]|nr:type II toxin-antitoxin system HicB family antitoxin [Armatimonadota bacterium]
MRHEYTVVYEQSEDGWIIARAPELPGAISQGRTMEEAEEMIEDAIKELLVYYRQRAREQAS